MKRTHTILTTLVLLLVSGSASAQTLEKAPAPEEKKPETKINGYFTFGAVGTDNNQYAGRVSEFAPARQGGRAAGGGALWGNTGKFYFDFRGGINGTAKDQDYWLHLDANRWWQTEVRYSRLPHRLDHDPLDTLDAAKGSIVVRHDDRNPSEQYSIARGELTLDSHIAVPRARWLKFKFGFRDERRDGHTQARTLSKCSNCHVVAQTRGVDQVTQDISTGVQLTASHVMFEYSYLNRKFREMAPTPTNVYDVAVQPVTGARIFDNRIQYQFASGALPFNHIPDVKRESHSARARIHLPRDVSLNMNYTQAYAENEETGLTTDSKVWSARLGVPLGKRLFFTARYRQMQIQGDNLWINVAEPVAVGGPQLGLTFAQSYPTYGPVDYLRESEESRRPTNADFELSYRLAKRTFLRAGYEFERVRRDHFEVYETQRNAFRVGITTRSQDRKWSARSRYLFEDVENPFGNLQAAWTAAYQPTPSPGTPPSPLLGTQYFTLYRAREADLSAFPARVHSGEHSVTWTPTDRFSMNAHLRWKSQTNEDLNRSSWGNSTVGPGAEAWFTPHPKVSLMVGYYYHRETGDTWFVVPVFDG